MLCHAPQPLHMLAHSPGRLGSCFYAEQTPVYSSKLCTKHCILWQAWLTTTRQNELPQLLIHFNTLLTLPLGEKSYNFKIICFHVKIYNPPTAYFFLEKEMATHSSVLAWRIPWTEKPGRLQSMGSHRVRHNWSDLAGSLFLLHTHSILSLSRHNWGFEALSRTLPFFFLLFLTLFLWKYQFLIPNYSELGNNYLWAIYTKLF